MVLLVTVSVLANEEADSAPLLDGFSAEEAAKLRKSGETFHFQAEVNRMMKLIINSLYKNKEIFLRELISNASDALDKIRFISLTNKAALDSGSELKIEIRADKDKKLLHITDTGIGMTKDDLIKNLGTIAKSGTSEFLQAIEEGADIGQIGQFGVGFYSVFLVADRVTVTSKHNNDDQYIWESTAESDFTIIKDPRGNTLGRGTQITLHMKEDADSYLQENTLRDLVKKYSEFINFPIYLWVSRTETVEVPDEESEETEQSEESTGEEVEDAEEETSEEKPKKTKSVQQTTEKFERVNENKPIWTRKVEDVSEEEYNEFYKLFTKETQNPMAHSHFKAEGEVEFRSILYIPARAPANLFVASEENISNIKLFVKRVFITDEVPDLLPRYLKFLRGLVDSDDLPLNVSRETLQQHKLLRLIRKKLTRKAFELFKKLAEDEEKYETFLKEYGTALKLGIVEDQSNRKRIAELVRFTSSTDGKLVSLANYVKNMKKGQDHIFFLAGASLEEIQNSPFLERLNARGYEVLLMPDPIDEYMVQSLSEYEGFRFQNIAKEGLKFGDEDTEEANRLENFVTQFKPLTDWFSEVLKDSIEKATISNRLTTSPVALVSSQFGVSGNMERIMRAQTYNNNNDPMASYYLTQKKILEINPKHPVITSLLEHIVDDKIDENTVELAHVLFDTAVLRSGYSIKDQTSFATRIEKIIRQNLGVDLDATPEVDEKPAPEREAEEATEDDGDEETTNAHHERDEL